MNRFTFVDTAISALKVIQRKPIGDDRGYLERLFCLEDLQSLLPSGKNIVQVNHTLTARSGTVRGMHFQHPPHAEIKFVSCLRGEVFDVAVDLRRGSETFLSWHGEVLSQRNRRTLVIPEGFAHGFQTLTDDCEMLYFHTSAYRSEAEGGLNALDSTVGIAWPLRIRERSPRDQRQPLLANDFAGIAV